MKEAVIVLAFCLQIVFGTLLANVKLPFLNPAGVTYINGPTPTGLVATPLRIPVQYTQQLQRSQIQGAFAQNPLLGVTAVGIRQIPAVADIPVTHVEAHHGVIQKVVDVVNPALKTKKFEVRRPAIQKHFYDIEERVIVRPAGSALLELSHPISKTQKGLDIVEPLQPVRILNGNVFGYTNEKFFARPTPVSLGFSLLSNSHPVNEEQNRTPLQEEQEQQKQVPQQQTFQDSTSQQDESQDDNNDDSIIVEARSGLNINNKQQNSNPNDRTLFETEARSRALQSKKLPYQINDEQNNKKFQRQNHFTDSRQQQLIKHFQQQNANERLLPQFDLEEQPQQRQEEPNQYREPEVTVMSNGASQTALPQPYKEPVVYNRQFLAEELQTNQQNLIKLLSGPNGISEIGSSAGIKSLPTLRSNDNFIANLIRGRVLSATTAPFNAEPTDERVSTRRFVFSQPIETVQEVDVIEPFTKVDKITVNTPTVFNTARLGIQRVHTSVPVYQQQNLPFAFQRYN